MSDEGLRIALVDDSEDDRFLFTVAFQKTGLRGKLIEWEDGDGAIKYFSQLAGRPASDWPTVTFLDLKMPGRNGFEVLEWVRGHPELKALRIIVLSGSYDPSDIKRARELGAADYVVKPIKVEKIREILSR